MTSDLPGTFSHGQLAFENVQTDFSERNDKSLETLKFISRIFQIEALKAALKNFLSMQDWKSYF